MRMIVVGIGVQGAKRRAVARKDIVATVDSVRKEVDFRAVEDVPPSSYDAALVCTPDSAKLEILRYLLSNGKHVLVEKPLVAATDDDIAALAKLAQAKGLACYTAYNHRFEPHFVRMRDLIASGELGRIYTLRMFYGNGTARLVRDSEWRDTGSGVLHDLGSHLLDTLRFWFDGFDRPFEIVAANKFENKANDHVVLVAPGVPFIQLEMTMLMWRNHFVCDLLAENGSAHIASLCKWGPASFLHRRRVLPSGRPPEEQVTIVRDDPTWALEYQHFLELCETGGTNLDNDIWINRRLSEIAAPAPSSDGPGR